MDSRYKYFLSPRCPGNPKPFQLDYTEGQNQLGSRDQIVALKEEVDRLTKPPSGFGIFLNTCEDGAADVFTGGRKMRVNVSPAVDLETLRPGQEVVLKDGYLPLPADIVAKELAKLQ